jgi:hypothetical protein
MEALETKKITKIKFVKQSSFKFLPTFRKWCRFFVIFHRFLQLLGKRLRNIK